MSLNLTTLAENPSEWRKRHIQPRSVDCIVAVPPYHPEDLGLPLCLDDLPRRAWPYIRWARGWLKHAAEFLKTDGHFYVYGHPSWLPHLLGPLESGLKFKYWIAIRTAGRSHPQKLLAEHTGLVMFSGHSAKFRLNKVRYPHPMCTACGRPLKDYGGRSHLRNPDGCLISDVWKDLEVSAREKDIPEPVLNRIIEMSDVKAEGDALLLLPKTRKCPRLPYPVQLELPYIPATAIDNSLIDQVHSDDILEFLRKVPSNSVDLAFADPPYNLKKAYIEYADNQEEDEYLSWCECWIAEYRRVLKTGGSMFLLNLPKWSIPLAHFASQHMHLRNWIVWDSLSEPRGKVMPAHYALLHLTKGPVPRAFNYSGLESKPGEVESPDALDYCLRNPCRRRRLEAGDDRRAELSDIWSDIHRIRHKKDRDYHPCQLPERLMERIIQLSTNPGDIVLDGLGGVGTTALAARNLGRRFILVDSDPNYVDIVHRKLRDIEKFGEVQKQKTKRKRKRTVSRKTLQMELVRLAEELGKVPTKSDVKKHGKYAIELYEEEFPVWSKATGAVRAVWRK